MFAELMVWFIVFNATFNNISVLLVEYPEKTSSHSVVSSTLHHEWGSNSQL